MTYHDADAKFTSVTQPFDKELNEQLDKSLRRLQDLSADVRLAYTCWLSSGPQYETEAEVNAIERLGGDVCGMTMPREAKVSDGSIAVVVAGHSKRRDRVVTAVSRQRWHGGSSGTAAAQPQRQPAHRLEEKERRRNQSYSRVQISRSPQSADVGPPLTALR